MRLLAYLAAAAALAAPAGARAQPAIDDESPSLPPPAVEVPQSPDARAMQELLLRSQEGLPVALLIDELLDELVLQLSKEDARALSPLAVRWIKLSPNLRADLATSAETRLQARLAAATQIVQVVCTDCRSLRSRVEGRDWVVSLGVVRQADLRALAEDIGARAFLDLDVQYIPGPEPRVTLAARAFRASDARLLFSTSIRGDETTAAVLRSGKKPITREEQLLELERKLERRPRFDMGLQLGVSRFGYDSPKGDIAGATFALRIQETFGRDKRLLFGAQGELFVNPDRLTGGIVTAVLTWRATEPNLNDGELRVGGAAGGLLGEKNTVVFEGGVDYLMKFRFSVGAGLIYIVPVQLGEYDLGGLGLRGRLGINW